MASYFSALNPVKGFPEYHGPYDVGTVDVEIPTSDLPSPSTAPERAQPTIAFRMFYPCIKPAKDEADRPVRWIPSPQKIHLASIMKYVGISERMAGLGSLLLRQLYWIKLPAHRNAKLLIPPTTNGRWPVTFFSHGLAGSRNAYSQLCGDLASNGTIVIAMDHRDGSSPMQYVRATATTEEHTVLPVSIPHAPVNDEVYEARDQQLRIRIWEMSMAYEALIKIDAGLNVENLDMNTSRNRKERMEVLWRFHDMMDIHRPGKVSWSGHSFGAATVVQLLKSVHYYKDRTESDGKPLFTPNVEAAITQQVAPESPAMFLDLWGLPLKSPQQKFLWDRPLPSYAVEGPDGANVLSILSGSFHNWKDNLTINKAVVARPSETRRPPAAPASHRERGTLLPAVVRLRAHSPADSGYGSAGSSERSVTPQRNQHSRTPSTQVGPERTAERTPGPHMFFIAQTQHFNQSDYGVLFPYITQKTTKAEEPERCLDLNRRAMVQVMREAGLIGGDDDTEILDRTSGLRKWNPVTSDGDEQERLRSRAGATGSKGNEELATDGMNMDQMIEGQAQKQ
ncbi:hypothetical protein LTR08_006257 [Meristemomyces frigidus]|nr:hypothetical protein LTR08_006257 [Meristemomyces frigidus]